jgi:hypothetical protein
VRETDDGERAEESNAAEDDEGRAEGQPAEVEGDQDEEQRGEGASAPPRPRL